MDHQQMPYLCPTSTWSFSITGLLKFSGKCFGKCSQEDLAWAVSGDVLGVREAGVAIWK